MIADLDDTLKQLLIGRCPLDPSQVDVTFDVPDREWSASLARPTINLYLYDIRENRELRETDWITERRGSEATGRRRPPVRVNLSYLITAWTRAVEDEHRLLWLVLATLFRHPVLAEDLLLGDLRQQGRPLRLATAQPDGVLRDPGDFWAALDNQLKPSISLTVTAELDLEVAIKAPPAREVAVALASMADRDEAARRAKRGGDGSAPAINS